MNLLDVVVVLLALGAVLAGFRLGFVTRARWGKGSPDGGLVCPQPARVPTSSHPLRD